jgi:hypothetical protein
VTEWNGEGAGFETGFDEIAVEQTVMEACECVHIQQHLMQTIHWIAQEDVSKI